MPFDTIATTGETDSILALPSVLRRVAARNPLLSALDLRREAAKGGITQAGVRPNPELEAEIEEVAWDAPGLNESEIVLVLSQEFELFGQRGARRQVAEAELKTTELEIRVTAFDLYLETQARYYTLVHAQEQFELSKVSIGLAEDIVATIRDRSDKGAALESELLLARLELQRADLAKSDAATDLLAAQIALATLWAGDPSGVRVVAPVEPKVALILERIPESMADSTRELLVLDRVVEQLNADRRLATVESKPNLTLSGGYKRLTADKSNSLIFGLSLPLPFRNQNRGTLQSLDAELNRVELERKQASLESAAAVASGVARLRQVDRRHDALDNELVPTAEDAYRTIEALYQVGRLPYTNLLEASRSLVELKFEHNDMLLAVREQIIALERLGGVILQADEDSNND
jgi:cobalt-zinc-cadmium efflux system outer membrane protein